MDPRIGTEFAGHRIESVLGRGGASVVYVAEHLRLGRKVALKILAPHLADDEGFRERFIRESRVAASLDHPSVVTVYDAGEVEGSLYISMRYVEGSDLAKLLAAVGALGPSRTIGILSQIASALDAAHARGLVHRDVKPANMLVEAARGLPGFERAYLSDFGISKRTTSREGLTRTGQFVGTVDYVAPEQITGEPVDGRTDVYSLGCVLFECLCGRVPFPGETGVATIYSHLHGAPPTLEAADDRGPGLDRVVARALAKSKESRYDTCVEMIQAARSELPISVPTTTLARPAPASDERAAPSTTDAHGPVRPLRRGGRRRRRVAAASAGAVALVLAAVALALTLPGDGPDPGDSRERAGTSPVAPQPTGPSGPTGSEPPLLLTWSLAYTLEKTFGGSGRQAILDAVVTDEDVVFAVGHVAPGAPTSGLDDAAVWRSHDGHRWKPVGMGSLEEEGDQRMTVVTVFEGLLVAAGWSDSDAAVWTSSDGGETWASSEAPDLGGVGFQRIRDLVSTDTGLVAVGSSGALGEQDAAVWTSLDGALWERMDPLAFGTLGQQELLAAVAVAERVVAVGFTNEFGDIDAAAWTYEGGTWTRVDPGSLAEPEHQIMVDIAAGGGGLPLVAVGCEDPAWRCDTPLATASDAVVWTSEEGASWDRVPPDGGRLAGEGEQAMKAVASYRGDLVAVGNNGGRLGDIDGGVWTSVDGVTWRAPSQVSPTVTALGGPGDQSLRALVVYSRRGITLLGFGVTNEGDVEDAQVWAARLLRS